MTTVLLIGTRKGLFLARSEDRSAWKVDGPHCDMWPINHAIYNPTTGCIHAAGTNPWYGPAVWTSPDLGDTWTHSSEGIAISAEVPVTALWSLAATGEALYLGTDPAAIFRSNDRGASWAHLDGLRSHPTAEKWMPGNAGLILHSLVADGPRLAVGISVGGVYVSDDAGVTWEPRAAGLPTPDPVDFYHTCVHHLDVAGGAFGRFFQQNHQGQFRSDDAGRSWVDVGAGLPSPFGFGCATHPRDPATFFAFPLNGDSVGRFAPDAAVAVWRTRDAGATWQACRNGLPQEHAYLAAYRQAMATDSNPSVGVYFGTTTGEVFASPDEGESWRLVAPYLPGVLSVEAAVLA